MKLLEVPSGHRSILSDPPLDDWGELIQTNRQTAKNKKLLVLGCAHECCLLHPGVLFKEIAVDRFKDVQSKANIFVDTEIPMSGYLEFPQDDGAVNIRYIDGNTDVAYSEMPVLSRETVLKIIDRVKGNSGAERFFNIILELRKDAGNMAELLVRAKVAFLEKFGFSLNQKSFKKLLSTDSYLEFYQEINKRKKEFIEIYNAGIASMAYQTGIKELSENELPFWKREGIEEPVPKAVPLNIFLRLNIFDLYVEGIGGSRYRPLADYVIENFYAQEPPETATVSATLWSGREPGIIEEEISNAQDTLRRMKENPQEFTGKEEDSEKVKKLVEDIRRTDDKSRAHRRLEEKKNEIRMKIQNSIYEKEMELDSLNREKTITSREYPFFVYKEEDIKYLFEKA